MGEQQFSTTKQTGEPVSSVALASSYARSLVEAERSNAGTDTRQSVASVARRLRRPAGTVWNLLFRAPKEVSYDLFVALEQALERKIERQIADLENELLALRASRRRLPPGTLAEAEGSLARLKASLGGEG